MSAAGLYAYRARVARWVDADTVDLDVDLGFSVSARLRFRLARVNAPERGQAGHDEALAIAAGLMPPGAPGIVESYKGDRYGRWIGEVRTLAGVNVSDSLLAGGVARYES
jgi:endonuclease YncB( thermonuclease family)